jgi:hypothetical protein
LFGFIVKVLTERLGFFFVEEMYDLESEMLDFDLRPVLRADQISGLVPGEICWCFTGRIPLTQF